MKISELSKELNITTKELIQYLNENKFNVKSHMVTATDEMIELAKEHFKEVKEKEPVTTEKEDVKKKDINGYIPTGKKYEMTDLIPCKSVTPCELVLVGVDKTTVYHWNYFGDVDYVSYRDLQSWRRNESITAPLILIEDPELCYQWRNDLKDSYQKYLGVEYPEEFFELSDNEFEDRLRKADKSFKEVIKITAVNMINNTNYPSIQKIRLIDDIFGTCLKDFL